MITAKQIAFVTANSIPGIVFPTCQDSGGIKFQQYHKYKQMYFKLQMKFKLQS